MNDPVINIRLTYKQWLAILDVIECVTLTSFEYETYTQLRAQLETEDHE